jgi:UDP-N-acetylglucosamine 2-epimerase (non-hydrolysing)
MIAVVLGTRPEIIKMSPIIRQLLERNVPHWIIHTGQHYSFSMDLQFFQDLHLPVPDFNLRSGSGSHAEQTARILTRSERLFKESRPDIILVQGDTTTVLAASLAAAKLHIPIGHVEAGLRSRDRRMPEEINRLLTDHLSSYLFAPTESARKNLQDEGIPDHITHVTGNTIVDAVQQALASTRNSSLSGLSHDLDPGSYAVLTLHREENVDDPHQLQVIFKALRQIGNSHGLRIIFPVHPRTRKVIRHHSLNIYGIETVNPLGFHDFLRLEKDARIIFTDSGGVQEEACIFKVPCVTIRNNTERPETVEIGANILAGTAPEDIAGAADTMIRSSRTWVNPYGDGCAGARIVEILLTS